MSITRWIVSVFTFFCLSALICYSVVLGVADVSFRDNNLTSLKTAVRLVPSNALYRDVLAEHLEANGANPDLELEKATELSPRESRFWIRRGFRAEIEEKYADAERYLLEARRVDHGFDPRWALMNYYFRRDNSSQFWRWTRDAFEMSYGNLTPLFRLCLAVNNDPEATRQVLPARRNALLQFLGYLLNNKPIQSSASTAEELAVGATADDVPTLLSYCTRQIAGNVESALLVWNGLCRRKAISFKELAPEAGEIITNADFSAAPLQQGFDWQYGSLSGVMVGPMDAAHGISIDIGGKQDDVGELLGQWVPVTPGRQYVVQYEYRNLEGGPESGIRWEIHQPEPTAPPGMSVLASSSMFSGKDWSGGQFTFASGRRRFVRLSLEYRRDPGTLRWKGTVQIRRVVSGLVPGGTL